MEWLQSGTSSKSVISCKAHFQSEPQHSEFISERCSGHTVIRCSGHTVIRCSGHTVIRCSGHTVIRCSGHTVIRCSGHTVIRCSGHTVIRCSGWRNPINMTLISKKPFLLFDISAQFSSDITDLSLIPHGIYVYGDHYRLGGATAYVADRSHYVGYICDTNNQILFYDGLPSLSPVLRAYPQNAIYGEISLLVSFPYENGLKMSLILVIVKSIVKGQNRKVRREPIINRK